MKVFGVLLGVGLFGLIVWLRIPSEEDLIVARLRDFTDTVSFEANIDPSATLSRQTQILDYFAKDAELNLGVPPRIVRGRCALATFLEQISLGEESTVNFVDAAVSFDRRLLIATGRLEVSIEVNQKNYGTRVFDVALRQIDGNWLLTDLRAVMPVE